MKRAICLLAVVLGGGCMSEMGGNPPPDGTGGSPGARSIVGEWINSQTASTATAYDFTADGRYAAILIRLTSLQTADTEIEGGTYETATAGEIHFHATQSTCGTPIQNYKIFYSWNGSYLVLRGDNVIVSYEPVTSMGTPITDRLGCFAADGSGTFTPMPIVNL